MGWFCRDYRGMYIHAFAFESPEAGIGTNLPGPKWNYRMAICFSPLRDDRLFGESSDDDEDYFTKEAAEQAALFYGRSAIDILHGLR
ncbi:hypothetical protein [Cupriavidus plantarum]|uniref:Uncharacterized protein n=1 Tax=Cupriavidus plantarum TaxID=942865 RepID=A0A316EPH9_9BURK|nr:hypothetical protein [Cupriavidus plantarum]NYI01624.1 hypothetical protein [Cupriavidus plantarum]PWK33760.1 hypothetical protein C7419_10379 [Cupriavidus plantarum]REE90939.1 hypothetical protein C7418_4237 [Cupriavidus plantarum]RLK33611.1 hypothetical protein C7417_4260 [Cupriavidus plantarum]